MPIHPAIAANPHQLKRLAALLLALAGLADRAAGRSGAVCWLVIWLLRPSEAVARAYLESLTPGAAWPPAPEPLRPRDGAAEAHRLARNLRTLAAALAALAALADYFPAPLQALPANRPGVAEATAWRPAGAAAPAGIDSS